MSMIRIHALCRNNLQRSAEVKFCTTICRKDRLARTAAKPTAEAKREDASDKKEGRGTFNNYKSKIFSFLSTSAVFAQCLWISRTHKGRGSL